MKKIIMYVFDGAGRLFGIQDVTSWPTDMITQARRAQHMAGRTAEVSDKGRAVCSVFSCRADLGERELPAGELSHGMCPEHYAAAMAEIETEVTK